MYVYLHIFYVIFFLNCIKWDVIFLNLETNVILGLHFNVTNQIKNCGIDQRKKNLLLFYIFIL